MLWEIIKELDKKVKESFDNDEIPIGAVIFDKDYNINASASNTRQKEANVLGHAEINAILKAEKITGDWRLDGYKMLVNLEPCDMCTTIIKESRLDKVFYFLGNNNIHSHVNINKEKLDESEYEKSAEKYREYLSTYFENKR